MEPKVTPQSEAPVSPVRYSIEQTDLPRPPRETLPTMYDLPSEAVLVEGPVTNCRDAFVVAVG